MTQGKQQRVIILGGGVIGLCSAYYALKRGQAVALIEREAAGGDNCSMGNAGMIVPSHFIPLAAPGMIAKGLRWMFNAESPFYIRPRLDPALVRWAWLFYRHSTERHVAESRELLRDLNLESRRLFTELAEEEDFGLAKRGMLMLCKTAKGLDEEAAVGAAARLKEEGADLITFTSASTVENFFKLGVPWPEGCVAGSIGPVTSEALKKHGIEPAFEAKPSDIPGLVAAVRSWAGV